MFSGTPMIGIRYFGVFINYFMQSFMKMWSTRVTRADVYSLKVEFELKTKSNITNILSYVVYHFGH